MLRVKIIHSFIRRLHFRANFDISSEFNFDDDDYDDDADTEMSRLPSCGLIQPDNDSTSDNIQQSPADSSTTTSHYQPPSHVSVVYKPRLSGP